MQKRSQTSREVIVRATAELIAAGRPADAGLVNICNAAGVTRGALYHHFRSIATLVGEVHEQARGRVLALVGESFARRDAEAPAHFSAALGEALTDDHLVRAGLRLAPDGTEEPPRLREEMLERVRAEILAGAPETADRSVLADLAVVVIAGLESLGYADRDWWSRGSAKRIWDVLLPLFAEAGPDGAEGGAGSGPVTGPARAAEVSGRPSG
ncbi:TetR/AcrR family transcriptional regulator [Streptomyces sp. NPDC052225]|uniref:TetR/AcrR family transcriptional regulator n=1 Tax=Streptomyces sp. NPDC052225 TaxID=3154949 RepID=UPI003422BBA3